MDVSTFDFYLPKELIAQAPLSVRSHSRMLVLGRDTGEITHAQFPHIINYLRSGDVLVLNNTRVRHARLVGKKKDTGAKIELLLLKPVDDGRWEALVKPAKRVKEGTIIEFGNDELMAVAEAEVSVAGGRIFHLIHLDPTKQIEQVIEQVGQAPLPPYIQEQSPDPERYQTVFSKVVGSAAAPTAGLHFTPDILMEIQKKGIEIAYITLHVGLGTFRPVMVESIAEHEMHSEYYEIGTEAAAKICRAQRNGGRVIAVGTTSVRTLETMAARYHGEVRSCQGWTNIFIHPGFEFKIVDGLLTNFHLPRSTLLMLVSAFSTQQNILAAYNEAVREKYRFFSFGDGMLII